MKNYLQMKIKILIFSKNIDFKDLWKEDISENTKKLFGNTYN